VKFWNFKRGIRKLTEMEVSCRPQVFPRQSWRTVLPAVQRDKVKEINKKLATDLILYGHRCEFCRQRWRSPEKADTCPRCGHWHINLNGSTFLNFERN